MAKKRVTHAKKLADEEPISYPNGISYGFMRFCSATAAAGAAAGAAAASGPVILAFPEVP